MKVSITDHDGSLKAVFHLDNGEFSFALEPDAAIELADSIPAIHTMAAQLRSRRTSEKLRAAQAAREQTPPTERSVVPQKRGES